MTPSSFRRKIKLFFYLTFLFLFILPRPAHAYIDLGSGSYIFQFLIAGGLGALFFFKGTLKRVVDWIKNFLPVKDSRRDGE